METNMADDDAEEILGEANLPGTSEIITVVHGNEVGTEVVSEDILQQALEEASEGFDQSTVEYATEDVPVADGSVSLTEAHTINVNEAYETQYELITDDQETDSIHSVQEGQTQTIQLVPGQSLLKSSQVQQIIDIGNHQHHVDHGTEEVLAVHHDGEPTQTVDGLSMVQVVEDQVLQNGELQSVPAPTTTTQTVTVLPSANNGEPLGSSQNPIRIIQQGNQYTSVQQLTQEQLSQIMQVVQQQQLARTTAEGGGSSVLFNPQTQTRIVYRVIYPSELHKTPGASVSSGKSAPRVVQVPTKLITVQAPAKRPYKRRNRGDEEEKVDGPELSKEEKEERKKHRPRTRSGRVSRPPKHMVQDYKHIHPLDWDEDYDDSDGGYSDFKMSDEEEEQDDGSPSSSNRDQSYILPGQRKSAKQKNFKCDVCEKAYIGRAGLGRHFRLYPSHGQLEILDPDSNMDENSKLSDISATGEADAPAIVESINGEDPSASSSKSAILGTTSATISQVAAPPAKPRFVIANRATQPVRGSELGVKDTPRAVIKARQAYMQENNPIKRKNRLKELVRQCEDEELMEVVLPRLARVITLWEFLLMKVERGRPLKPHFMDIYREFEQLHKQVAKMCQEFLKPACPGGSGEPVASSSLGGHANKIQITNQAIAQSFGLTTGPYEVHDAPVREESAKFQYKLLTADPLHLNSGIASQHGKRTVELVTPDQLVVQPAGKRPRIDITPISSATGTPSTSISAATSVPSTTIQIVNGGTVTQDEEGMAVEESVDDSPVPNGEEVETQEEVSVPEPILRTQISGATGGNMHVIMTNGQMILRQVNENGSVEQSDIVVAHAENDAGTSSEKPHSEEKLIKVEHVKPEASQSSSSQASVVTSSQQSVVMTVADPSAASSSEHSSMAVEANSVQVYSGSIETGEMETKRNIIVTSESSEDHQNVVEGHVVLSGGEAHIEGHLQHGQIVDQDGNIVLGLSHIENQVVEGHVEGHLQQVQEVHLDGAQVAGQIIENDGGGTQVLIQQGDMSEQQTEDQASIYQTAEGLILIQNPDGTFQLHGPSDQPIPLETVQALLAMESEGQAHVEQVDET